MNHSRDYEAELLSSHGMPVNGITLLIIQRPFGGFDIYNKGKKVSVVRPYMNGWTFTYRKEEERFISDVYGEIEFEFPQWNNPLFVIEHIKKRIKDEMIAEQRRKNRIKNMLGY